MLMHHNDELACHRKRLLEKRPLGGGAELVVVNVLTWFSAHVGFGGGAV